METNVTTKSKMSTKKKVLIGTGIGLVALSVIGLLSPDGTVDAPEPVAVVETSETKVEWEPEIDVEAEIDVTAETEANDEWINEAAANIAWSNMEPTERQAMCDAWNFDSTATKSMAKATWNEQGLEAGLQKELLKLIRTTC